MSAPPSMGISLGDDAQEAYINAVALSIGYTLALLPEGVLLSQDSELGPCDFSPTTGTDVTGFRWPRHPQTNEPTGPEITVPWADVVHVHVY